ncbi:hypothetical protein [Mesorhizobium sp. ANAO-SY3R2]|uniref:hypothetical protein n=1 Tax=Mesorhizobium sp. ANAO-SY3R2 TaxID=3166644 RepID=UPI00366B7F24
MTSNEFQQVISLGPNCRARFHIDNLLGKYKAKRGVFDWQGTPSGAVIEYLRRDFQGLFERCDLVIEDRFVRNRRFGTSHRHAFPEGLAESLLDELYPLARARHDLFCKVTRGALRNGLSTLFVLCKPIPPEHMEEIAELIEQVHPGRRFAILPAPEGDHDDHSAGDSDRWAKHLSRFTLRPPLSVVAKCQLRRFRRNLRNLKPRFV